MSCEWKQNAYLSETTISGEQLFVCLFVWTSVCEVWGPKAGKYIGTFILPEFFYFYIVNV